MPASIPNFNFLALIYIFYDKVTDTVTVQDLFQMVNVLDLLMIHHVPNSIQN